MDGVEAPADGVITGYGKIDGRLAAVCAYDFTVMAGSMGMTGEIKTTRLRELALTKRIPFVWLLDSAGARVQEAAGAMFAGSGHLFREEVVMSGVIPQVAALMGPCAAGTAYIPGLADFVPMVKGRGSMALAGPHLVRAAVGEDVTQEELGGSRVHCRKSGVGDMEVDSDEECVARIKEYLSYMPSNCERAPPRARAGGADPTPSTAPRRRCWTCCRSPTASRTTCTTSSGSIVDDGEYLDIKRQWAQHDHHLLRALRGPARGDRRQPAPPAGGHPRQRLRRQGRAVREPLQRVRPPARVPPGRPRVHGGHQSGGRGIIRHGAKMLYAVANATVPKMTVITRKAYGAGYYVMNGRAYEPDLIVAWPSAEISVMGAEGVVEIAFRKVVEEAADPAAKRAELIEGFRKQFDVYIAAGNDLIDDVIDPRETRATICRALEMAEGKQVERPWKRHGVVPV